MENLWHLIGMILKPLIINNDGQLNLAEAQSLKEALAIKQFEFADKDSDGKLNYEAVNPCIASIYTKSICCN